MQSRGSDRAAEAESRLGIRGARRPVSIPAQPPRTSRPLLLPAGARQRLLRSLPGRYARSEESETVGLLLA